MRTFTHKRRSDLVAGTLLCWTNMLIAGLVGGVQTLLILEEGFVFWRFVLALIVVAFVTFVAYDINNANQKIRERLRLQKELAKKGFCSTSDSRIETFNCAQDEGQRP